MYRTSPGARQHLARRIAQRKRALSHQTQEPAKVSNLAIPGQVSLSVKYVAGPMSTPSTIILQGPAGPEVIVVGGISAFEELVQRAAATLAAARGGAGYHPEAIGNEAIALVRGTQAAIKEWQQAQAQAAKEAAEDAAKRAQANGEAQGLSSIIVEP